MWSFWASLKNKHRHRHRQNITDMSRRKLWGTLKKDKDRKLNPKHWIFQYIVWILKEDTAVTAIHLKSQIWEEQKTNKNIVMHVELHVNQRRSICFFVANVQSVMYGGKLTLHIDLNTHSFLLWDMVKKMVSKRFRGCEYNGKPFRYYISSLIQCAIATSYWSMP